jgi:hypothetical protein
MIVTLLIIKSSVGGTPLAAGSGFDAALSAGTV